MIKFSSSNPPSFVKVQEFTTGVDGFWVTINNNDIKLTDGDYIDTDDSGNPVRHIPGETADTLIRQQIKEAVGRQVVRYIWKTLADSGLTNVVKASIQNTISATLIACLCGEVQAARIIANATATTSDFTNARKTILLNLIDEGIAKL